MKMIKHLFRVPWASLTLARSYKKGSKKLYKWVRKNKKAQDETLYDYNYRWEYAVKKQNKLLKKMGVKVNVVGIENLPKGPFWMTPNHSSNFDGFYLVGNLGHKARFAAISREDLKDDKRSRGYLISSDSFFIDRDNLRQSVAAMNAAAQYAKANARGICVFPEGKRSINAKLLEFKPGTFKFPQKYFLPIVPVSITGTLEARRWWALKERVVTINVHEPIRPSDHSRIESTRLAENVQKIIQHDLDKYYKSLDAKGKALYDKLQAKATIKQEKIDAKWLIKKEKYAQAKASGKYEASYNYTTDTTFIPTPEQIQDVSSQSNTIKLNNTVASQENTNNNNNHSTGE